MDNDRLLGSPNNVTYFMLLIIVVDCLEKINFGLIDFLR